MPIRSQTTFFCDSDVLGQLMHTSSSPQSTYYLSPAQVPGYFAPQDLGRLEEITFCFLLPLRFEHEISGFSSHFIDHMDAPLGAEVTHI